MNKCWFILQQSCYTPPEYANASRAGGRTIKGDLRLGDVVPSPKNIYPILTEGELPFFPREMRISSTRDLKFDWDTTREKENSGSAGAGLPVAAVAGATINTEISAEFKRTMKSWAEFQTLDTEKVQPSSSYINHVLAQSGVADYIEQLKYPLLNRWSVFIVTGLMIARAGGTIGNSQAKSQAFGGGGDFDVPSTVNVNIHSTYKDSTENNRSAEFQGDRVWAVRFAKVHKGLLRPRWMQTEETVGAALDGGGDEEERVSQVLEYEGIRDVQVVDFTATRAEDNRLVFVIGQF